ncbi:hypothetical protein PSMK_02220 [Phycisphaera mikurensis NBRC 102666]|uniref:Uncharacterized protein n=1 Tax=Phycisphaera mikurensis (strain NBRC 102666 / KCTC 22515 / FYK2301M01) TaxID=1142394 RepID=I0IAU3_PHYMF|nr:hypothetical protein PSMK_02220 [Phycisphaera mikurensis NBRC 102666]
MRRPGRRTRRVSRGAGRREEAAGLHGPGRLGRLIAGEAGVAALPLLEPWRPR